MSLLPRTTLHSDSEHEVRSNREPSPVLAVHKHTATAPCLLAQNRHIMAKISRDPEGSILSRNKERADSRLPLKGHTT
jgi:hypothetical protein